MNVVLLRLPGNGFNALTAAPGTTLEQFAQTHSVSDRDLVVNGETIGRHRWSTFELSEGVQVAATLASKGNCR